ncbi:hypothetical protein MUP77_02170 [Candidatus Bathyarchaeota archaeon]|nr:hypothetical protein [Candidatus Bathyarchaeota archaeon]
MQIRLEPWKEIIFHDAQQLSTKELLHLQAMSIELAQAVTPLTWADGVLYSTTPMLDSEELCLEQMDGKVHFSSIFFSFMPTYMESVRSGRIDIPVLDLSYNTIAKAVASWVKENFRQISH